MNKVLTITTEIHKKETASYEIDKAVWIKLKQAKTQQEKQDIYNSLSVEDMNYIGTDEEENYEEETIDYGIYHD